MLCVVHISTKYLF